MSKILSKQALKLLIEKLISECFDRKMLYEIEVADLIAVLKSIASATIVERKCVHCESEFYPSRVWQRFCSNKCAQVVRSLTYVHNRLAQQPKQKCIAIEERFELRIQKTNDCWLWIGPVNNNGYPRFSESKKTIYAHRWAYERWNGPLRKTDMVHHSCHQRTCVNPRHLQAVTRAEHIKIHQPQLTHCQRGHVLSAENTFLAGYNSAGEPRKSCRKCRTASRLRTQRQSVGGRI